MQRMRVLISSSCIYGRFIPSKLTIRPVRNPNLGNSSERWIGTSKPERTALKTIHSSAHGVFIRWNKSLWTGRCHSCSKSVVPTLDTATVHDDKGKNSDSSSTLGKIEPGSKLYLSFTCTVCNGSNSYTISKQAYNHGVVIVTCKGCSNHHLIADNLDWFNDIKGKNIEEILAQKGEKVTKFLSSDVKEIVPD